MSLTGNLEDLPLLDILQIVSFSRKSGHLSIQTGEGEGGIVFVEGLVVAAFTWNETPLDPRLDTMPEGGRQRVIRTRIEIALEQLIRLREGQFKFSLTAEPPTVVGSRDISRVTLSVGFNPQELLLDLARGMDEDRRDSTAAVEAAFVVPDEPSMERSIPPGPRDLEQRRALAAGETMPISSELLARIKAPAAPAAKPPPAVPSPPAPVPEAPRTVLLVDDEEDVRRLLGDALVNDGIQVVEAEDPETAVKKGGRLGKQSIPFVLLTDLGMPTSGGSSFQGGFEVVKRLWKMNVRPPVLMMTERINRSIQLRAKQMGIDELVFKPGLSRLNPEQFDADLRAFAARIIHDLLPRLGREAGPRPAAPKAATRPAAARGEAAGPTIEELSRQLSLLQQRLSDLRQPGDANQVAVLLMRLAREFFERGILFLVKNEEARGLAAFGPAPKGQNINLLVREVVIPLSEPSPFLDVVESAKPFQGSLPDGKWSKYLMGRIGRFQSDVVALFPLVTNRETIAVLFADNPETGRGFGRLDALEVFVNQAGVALENTFLHKKLRALQAKG